MKTVTVCNINIEELIYHINCKLGELGTDLMYQKKYAIKSCDDIKLIFSELVNYRDLFLDILKNRNSSEEEIIDIINLPMICNMCDITIEKMIERTKDLLHDCLNCKGTILKLIDIEDSSFINEWYISPEYIECLQFELEENGWIDPLVDLCQNLNITISAEKLCKDIAIQLATIKVECMTISEINVQSAFNNMLISKYNINIS